jgi:hypothetical protein
LESRRTATQFFPRAKLSVTYYVALPFINSEEGPVPGEAMECPNEGTALLRAEAMSRKEGCVGALALKRTGEPNQGNFGDQRFCGRLDWCRKIWMSFEIACTSTPLSGNGWLVITNRAAHRARTVSFAWGNDRRWKEAAKLMVEAARTSSPKKSPTTNAWRGLLCPSRLSIGRSR